MCSQKLFQKIPGATNSRGAKEWQGRGGVGADPSWPFDEKVKFDTLAKITLLICDDIFDEVALGIDTMYLAFQSISLFCVASCIYVIFMIPKFIYEYRKYTMNFMSKWNTVVL